MICRICNKTFPDKKLGLHIARTHKMSAEVYYLKYLGKRGYCLSCGKPTKFITIETGFGKYCSRKCSCTSKDRLNKCKATWISTLGVDNPSKSIKVKKSKEKTFKKHYGVTCSFKIPNLVKNGMLKSWGVEHPMDSKEIKNKLIQTNRKKRNVDCVFQDSKVKSRIHKIMLKRYKVKYPMQSTQIKEKTKNTFLKNWGVKHPMKDSTHCSLVMDKIKKSIYSKYEVDSWAKTKKGRKFLSSMNKDPLILKKKENTCIKKYGVSNPAQNPKIHKKIFSNKRKKYHGFMSNSEYEFSLILKRNNIKFKNEYYLNGKHWDFAIYYKNKISLLVEIDGEYYHGIKNDYDGIHIRGEKDHLRFSLVPRGMKFLTIDSLRINEAIPELKKILKMTYREFLKYIYSLLPKKFTRPKFSKERLKSDYSKLCRYKYNPNARLGYSSVIYFNKDLYDIPWDKHTLMSMIRNHKLYYSRLSNNKLYEYFIKVSNPSKLKHRLKYSIKDKHSNLALILACCSSHKKYKGKFNKYALKMIKFLNLRVNNDTSIQDGKVYCSNKAA